MPGSAHEARRAAPGPGRLASKAALPWRRVRGAGKLRPFLEPSGVGRPSDPPGRAGGTAHRQKPRAAGGGVARPPLRAGVPALSLEQVTAPIGVCISQDEKWEAVCLLGPPGANPQPRGA